MTDLIQRGKEIEQFAKNEKYLLGKNKSKPKGETLLQKGKKLEKIDEVAKKRFLFLLDKEQEMLNERSRDNLLLMQKSLESGVEFMKLGKKKQHRPVEVIETEKLEDTGDVPKVEKIIYYSEKYRIPYIVSGYRKTLKELEKEIQKYEKKYLKQLLNYGKDKKFGEFGLFIKNI